MIKQGSLSASQTKNKKDKRDSVPQKNLKSQAGSVFSVKKEISKIRKYMQMHGGDIKFKEFNEKTGTLVVSLLGACENCPMSRITLQEGVLSSLKAKFKNVKKVVQK